MKSTLTKKQIQAKLLSLKYSMEGDLVFELLEGYMDGDAEDTEIEPYLATAKTSLENLFNKFGEMLQQYEIDEHEDMFMNEDEVDRFNDGSTLDFDTKE
jgi:hypothetical protein